MRLLVLLACLSGTGRAQSLTLNAQTLGVVPGSDGTPTIQAAVDKLAAALRAVPPGVVSKATLYFPGDARPYKLSHPVFVDADFVEIAGDGNSTRFESWPGQAFPHFVFGIRRWAGTPAAYAAYRPDLFGRLDRPAASAAGQRWGWSSRGDSFLMATASPLNAGGMLNDGSWATDNFARGQQFTVEFAVDGHGPVPGGFCAGIVAASNPAVPKPFWIYADGPDHFTALFGTQAAPFAPVVSRRIGFGLSPLPVPPKPLPVPATTRRVAIQVDLATGRYGVYADGICVGLDLDQMGLAPSASLRFAENDFTPLLIGDGGGARPSWSPSGVAFDLLGFTLSRSLRYAWGAPGSVQTRPDGKPITDQSRYFTARGDDPGHLASLAFTDDPATCSRLLTVQGGPTAGNLTSGAWLLHPAMLGAGTSNTGQSIRDVQLMGGRVYGSNIVLGQVIKFRASGVRSRETFHGIASAGFGAIYPIGLDRLDLDGSDAAIFLQSAIVRARDLTVNGAGRSTLRFSGCDVDLDGLFVAFPGTNTQSTLTIHGGDYGGKYAFRNVAVDNEGSGYTRAPIYAEDNPYGMTTLRLTDWYLGTTGPASVPLLQLRALARTWPATLAVDGLDAAFVAGKAGVDVDASWRGSVVNSPGINPVVAMPVGSTASIGITMPGVQVVPVGPVSPQARGAK